MQLARSQSHSGSVITRTSRFGFMFFFLLIIVCVDDNNSTLVKNKLDHPVSTAGHIIEKSDSVRLVQRLCKMN